MGLAPGIAPGRVALAVASEELTREWGELPQSAGRDTTHILQSAAAGDIAVLVLLGADPLADFPDRSLAKSALERVPFVLSLATNLDASSASATVVRPVTADGERSGTTTNLEGRVSRLAAKVATPGVVWAPWIVATEIARAARVAAQRRDGSPCSPMRSAASLRPYAGGWPPGVCLAMQIAATALSCHLTSRSLQRSRGRSIRSRRQGSARSSNRVPRSGSATRVELGSSRHSGVRRSPTASPSLLVMVPDTDGPGRCRFARDSTPTHTGWCLAGRSTTRARS